MHDFWSKPIAMLRSKRSGLSLEEKVKDYKVKDSSLRRRGARGERLLPQGDTRHIFLLECAVNQDHSVL